MIRLVAGLYAGIVADSVENMRIYLKMQFKRQGVQLLVEVCSIATLVIGLCIC